MRKIFYTIDKLIDYAIKKKLIEKEDKIFITNRILEILEINNYEETKMQYENEGLENILNKMSQYLVENKIIDDTITQKDIMDSKIMGILIPRPSEIIKNFYSMYKENPKTATEYYYNLSKDSNYIRTERIKKDLKWKTKTSYGNLEITINNSKPEKDPKDIANIKPTSKTLYPKCVLCKESEGYRGRCDFPGRSNHRIIPINLNEKKCFFQYSPYLYFNEHSIVLNSKHVPMKIEKNTLIELLDFVDKFKHYFLGSNADLPIVGGSILAHDHYQGGNHNFPIENAKVEDKFIIKGFEKVDVEKIKWPLTVIRLKGNNKNDISNLANIILEKWRSFSCEEVEIISHTHDILHNTITPIARFKNQKFEMDLVLRNNRTTNKYPFGIFHPHEELHHIKKENIGLIEVMGLAVLPSRLMKEMEDMKAYILHGEYSLDIEKHIHWLDSILAKNKHITSENVDSIIKNEIGFVFEEVLLDCGVFKNNKKGRDSFKKFINTIV